MKMILICLIVLISICSCRVDTMHFKYGYYYYPAFNRVTVLKIDKKTVELSSGGVIYGNSPYTFMGDSALVFVSYDNDTIGYRIRKRNGLYELPSNLWCYSKKRTANKSLSICLNEIEFGKRGKKIKKNKH